MSPHSFNHYSMLLVLFFIAYGFGEECDEAHFKYTYTSCDSGGERWRVAVPLSATRTCKLPEPTKGLNCSFSCPAGNYLDLDTQKCRPCRAGFFSLGGGRRFEEFTTLPAGFDIETFDTDGGTSCPEESGWIVKDGELIYNPTTCISRLSFSANLVRPGSVEFTYRLPRNNRALSMHVDVRNEQCQSYSDLARSALLKLSSKEQQQHEERNGDWRRRRVDMKSGANVISWTVTNSLDFQTSEPIRLTRIDVLGLAFTRECSACPPGTYSNSGAAECQPCAAGYYSTKGSAQCGKCPQSQYSAPKSSECIDRPPCRQTDYYATREPCDTKKTTRIIYRKVLPAVCRDDVPGAFAMPADDRRIECSACNPGMAMNKDGVCEFCSTNFYSTGNECLRCPVDTIPNYGLQYIKWDSMPPKIKTRCEYISDDVSIGCDIGDAWIPSGDYLSSAPTLERGIALEMILSIDEGFSNPLAAPYSRAPIARITIVFETVCSDASCALYFIEETSRHGFRFLAAFNGTQTKRVWSHSIVNPAPTKFMLAFIRSRDSFIDISRVYSINVTNVAHKTEGSSGASECLSCPRTGSSGCVPCMAGHYMHEETKKCEKCPEGSVINATSTRIGKSSCIPCGYGLQTEDGVTCTIPKGKTSLSSNNATYSYDFSSWLNRSWVIDGVRVYSRDGSAYYHTFHLNLFEPSIGCEENLENAYGIESESANGTACRFTVFPSPIGFKSNQTKDPILVSPFLLATRLQEISFNRSMGDFNLTDGLLEYDGSDEHSNMDVFFWYEPVMSGVTSQCPHGNVFVVVARCEPSKAQPQLRLPRSCPDGTCDGCQFVVILESAKACPICDPGDYEIVNGECVNGKQTIHAIPHKHCVISKDENDAKVKACSNFTPAQRMMIITLTFLIIGLTIIVCMMCKKNQKLEYKYTRLIESRTGELPNVESCGLEDSGSEDEELQDRVIFSKGRAPPPARRNNEHDNAAFIALDNDD